MLQYSFNIKLYRISPMTANKYDYLLDELVDE